MLIVPGAAGEIGVLARHAPLDRDAQGGLDARALGEQRGCVEFATGPGFFKVEQDRALALVDDAVDAKEIDDARRRRSSRRRRPSSSSVERGESDADRWQLEQRIRHAENQLSVVGSQSRERTRSGGAAAPSCYILSLPGSFEQAAWRPGYQTPKEPASARLPTLAGGSRIV